VCDQEIIEDDDETSGGVEKEREAKTIKDTNKLEERDAVLRATQNPNTSDVTIGVNRHTVDVKNNVEKGCLLLLFFIVLGSIDPEG